jgi:hypothetical protein
VVAGPFGDEGNLRGLYLFRVGSLEEAKELTATGRLALDIHPWLVPDGILP